MNIYKKPEGILIECDQDESELVGNALIGFAGLTRARATTELPDAQESLAFQAERSEGMGAAILKLLAT